MKQKKSDDVKFIRITFYILFGVLGIFALLTPHLFHGLYFLNENLAQSIVLLIDFIVGYVFYKIYVKKIQEINENKRQLETGLINSYAYIGKVNNKIDLMGRFMNFFYNKEKEPEKDELFPVLLSNMINTVIKSEEGLIRFIENKSGKTIKDFYVSSTNDKQVPKISNRRLLDKELDYLSDIYVIESSHEASVRCFLAFPRQKHDIDNKLLQTLLNQLHLIFLVIQGNRIN